MTALEPSIQEVDRQQMAAVAVPLPPRIRSFPGRRRSLVGEALDLLAVAVNRTLDALPIAHAIHRRALARMEYTDVPLAVGARPGLDGLKIAFLTDLHAGSFLEEDGLLAICEEVTRRQPDLICFGGDLINSRACELELLDGPLRALDAPLGVFAVPGNHDHRWFGDMTPWQEYLERRGVEVIANRGRRLRRGGDSLWLCGVDDLTDGTPDLDAALAGRHAGEATVLLAHQPDHFIEARDHGVDLVLSGHTHGGQVKLFGWAPVKHTRHGFVSGGYRHAHSRLYVSRGVGATVLPLRFGARPEIPIVRLCADPS